jgi:hypothetical protein
LGDVEDTVADRQTQEEILAARQASMGAELGELHFLLWKEVVDLHLRWNVYRKLFAGSQDRFDLMNATAPRFFVDLNHLMWHDVLLHLARITDPPSSVGKTNLTIRAFESKISEPDLSSDVHQLVEEARRKTEFARDWRNRHLAHRDMERAKNPKVEKLAAASRAHVEDALGAIRAVLDCVQLHYEGSQTHYQGALAAGGGTEALMYFLRKGHDTELAERTQKLKEACG